MVSKGLSCGVQNLNSYDKATSCCPFSDLGLTEVTL